MSDKLNLTDGCIVEAEIAGMNFTGPVVLCRGHKTEWRFANYQYNKSGEGRIYPDDRITRVIAPAAEQDHGDGTVTSVATIPCRLPKGWRAVGWRIPGEDEFFISDYGEILKNTPKYMRGPRLIVERIPPQEPITLTPEQVAGLSKEAREEVLGVASS